MSAPIDVSLLRSALLVHRSASFSVAAKELGVPRSTVSRAVAALEESLGVALFQRTTRRVATTPDGAAFFERVAPAMAGLDSALSDFRERSQEPSGVVSVTATADVAAVVLAEAVARFTARYPKASVDTIVSNKMLDLVHEGIDLALRLPSRPMTLRSLVRRKVGAMEFSFYAAPAYLARRGVPRSDAELAGHDRVDYRGMRPVQFRASGGEPLPAARAVCDDMFFLRELVRKGVGIGVLPTFVAEADVTRGTLVPLRTRHRFGSIDVYLVRPARKQVPPRVTAFSDVLLELLRQRPLGAR